MSAGAPADATPTADTILATSGTGQKSAPGFERGASVGRYLIIEQIGEGGMGTVFAAYDPELDRKVALKALHATTDPREGSAGRTRLVREAKAMARLSHPNVVTVYDVVVEGDHALVAMELIEGETLRMWLRLGGRTWQETIAAFVQAGRGLVAAHEAGIVHRDFKSDNVFVGKDGRVRVGDFGLARPAPAVPEPGAEQGALAAGATGDATHVAGTPAYMAPAQIRGAPGDERSDQFAFCTALYDALYGVMPFKANTLIEHLDAIDRQELSPAPAGTAVPRWLRTILVRGLRARPEERYPSMREVVAALERDPRAKRAWFAVGAVALVGAAGAGLWVAQSRRADAARCLALAHRVEGVWDDAAKRETRDAFATTGRPYAQDAFERTANVLGAYGTSLAGDEVAQCDARRRSPADALTTARMDCLDQRLGELNAFVSVLKRADASTVDHAVEGARALPGLDVCEGKDPSRGRIWPGDPVIREQAKAIVEQTGVVDATSIAGRYPEALEGAQKAAAQAERVGFVLLIAETRELLAERQFAAGDQGAAEKSFHQAALAAERAGDARVAAKAWLGTARREADHGEPARADAAFDHAEAWTDKVGDDDLLRAKLWYTRGMVYSDAGRLDESQALVSKALALFEKHGDEHEAMAATNGLGIDADLRGHVEEAAEYYRRVIAWRERVLGPDHPEVAIALNNLGTMMNEHGEHADAAPILERALAIRQRVFAPDNRLVGFSLTGLSEVYVYIGREAEALALAQRGLAITEKAYGASSPRLAFALEGFIAALLRLKRYAEAVAPAERALAIRQKAEVVGLAIDSAKKDLGIALVRSGRDPERGRAMLADARGDLAQKGRTEWVAEIDEALAAP